MLGVVVSIVLVVVMALMVVVLGCGRRSCGSGLGVIVIAVKFDYSRWFCMVLFEGGGELPAYASGEGCPVETPPEGNRLA